MGTLNMNLEQFHLRVLQPLVCFNSFDFPPFRIHLYAFILFVFEIQESEVKRLQKLKLAILNQRWKVKYKMSKLVRTEENSLERRWEISNPEIFQTKAYVPSLAISLPGSQSPQFSFAFPSGALLLVPPDHGVRESGGETHE